MATAAQTAEARARKDVADRWLLSAPALFIIFVAAIGPLFIVRQQNSRSKGSNFAQGDLVGILIDDNSAQVLRD